MSAEIYSEYLTATYQENVAKHPHLKKQIEGRRKLVATKPYHYSEDLGQGKWRNLKGLRSAHMMGGKYVFLIAICEDCIRNGHIEVNLERCGNICEKKDSKRIVFVAFGLHDVTYGKP